MSKVNTRLQALVPQPSFPRARAGATCDKLNRGLKGKRWRMRGCYAECHNPGHVASEGFVCKMKAVWSPWNSLDNSQAFGSTNLGSKSFPATDWPVCFEQVD